MSSAGNLKWRAILPDSGDRVGPFSSADLTAWLVAGRPPNAVDREDAGAVAADPGALQLCGILASDYNAQKLPGEVNENCVWCVGMCV